MSIKKVKDSKMKTKIYFKIIEDRLVSLNETYIEGIHEGFIEIDTKNLRDEPKYLLEKIREKK